MIRGDSHKAQQRQYYELEDIEGAIPEMARVARLGAIITEPADAKLNALAIQLGIIPAIDDAGNVVN